VLVRIGKKVRAELCERLHHGPLVCVKGEGWHIPQHRENRLTKVRRDSWHKRAKEGEKETKKRTASGRKQKRRTEGPARFLLPTVSIPAARRPSHKSLVTLSSFFFPTTEARFVPVQGQGLPVQGHLRATRPLRVGLSRNKPG
jgi:hypothetical protein